MRMRYFLIFISLIFVSCAVNQYMTNEDIKIDSSGIADDLADKFAVSDTKEASLAQQNAPKNSATAKEIALPKTKNASLAKSKPMAKNSGKKTKDIEIPVRRPNGPMPFLPGERTVLALTYFGVEAGTLDLRVLPYKYIGGRKTFHIRGQGYSTSVFALFYRVDDVGESFMDADGLFSHRFQLKIDESLQKRDLVELYDQQAHQVHYWEKYVHNNKGLRITQFSKEILEYTQDAVTAAFYLRTLPLEVGKEYSFPVVSNGQPWLVTAKVLRREKLMTEKGEFSTLVIQPETRFEGMLKKTGDIFFWLSDDEHKSFLKIDAKIKVGKVIAYLKSLEYGKAE